MYRFSRWFIAFILGGLLLLVLLYGFRHVLVGPVINRFLVRQASGQLDLTIGEIGGNYFSTLEFLAVKAVSVGETDKISVHYSLPALARGFEAFLATVQIRVQTARLLFDFTAEKSPQPEDKTKDFLLPSYLPQLTINDAFLQINTTEGSFTGRGLSLTVGNSGASGNSEQEINLHADQAIFASPGFSSTPVKLSAQLHYNQKAITLDSLLVDTKPVVSQGSIQIADLARGQAAFAATLHLFDGELQMQGSIHQRQLAVNLQAIDADLTQNPPFLNSITNKIAGNITGTGSIALDLDHPSAMIGSVDLHLQNGSFYGRKVDQLGLRARAGEGILNIAAVDYLSGPDTLTIRDADLPLPILLQGDLHGLFSSGTGDFSASLSDAGQLLSFTGLDATKLPGQTDFSLRLTGRLTEGILDLQGVHCRFGNNIAEFNSLSLPVADLLAADETYTLLPRISGDFSLQSDDIPEFFALIGQDMPTVVTRTTSVRHHLLLSGSMDNGSILLDKGEFTAPGSTIHLQQGRITLPVDTFSFNGMEMASQLEFRIDDLAELAELFPLGPVAGALAGTINLQGRPLTMTGSVSLLGDHLIYAGLPIGTLRLHGEIIDGTLISDEFTVVNNANRISGSGAYRLADHTINNLHLAAFLEEPMAILQGFVPETLVIQGHIRADLEAEGAIASPHVVLSFEIADGKYKNITVDKASGNLTGNNRMITVDALEIIAGATRADLTGTIERHIDNQRLTIVLATMEIVHKQTTMQLVHGAAFVLDRTGSLTITDMDMTGDLGTINAAGLLQENAPSDFSLAIQGLTAGSNLLEALFGKPLSINDGNMNVRILGSRRHPDIQASGTVTVRGRLHSSIPFSGAFDIRFTENGLDFQRFSWTVPDSKTMVDISGHLPFDILNNRVALHDELHLNARLELPELQRVADLLPAEYAAGGSLHGQLLLEGTPQNPKGKLHFIADDVTIQATWPYLPPGPFSCKGDLELASDKLTLTKAELHSPAMTIEASGQWMSPPFSLQAFRNHENLLTGSLDMRGKLTMEDINWLADDFEAIQRLTGRLTMEAGISGPINKPRFTGTLRIVDGEVRSSYNFPTIRKMILQADLKPDRIDIQSLQGELGGAPFTVSGSITDIQGSHPNLTLQLNGKNLLLYRDEEMRFRSDVDVKVSGPLNQMAMAGEMQLTDGRINRRFDFLGILRQTGSTENKAPLQLFSFAEPPFNSAGLNIRIFSGKSIDISNNITSGSIRPDIILIGTGELPVITGNIYLDPIRIRMPSGTLYMNSGLIHFSEVDPDLQQIDLNGQARLLGYDITVLISGTIEEPVITLSSSPPLPEDELLLLILTGKPPQSQAGMDTLRKSSMNIALYLGRDMLRQLFSTGDTEADQSALERFELEIGRGITRLGEETIEAQYRLAEDVFFDNDVVFLTAEKDIYDSINSGIKIVFRFK